MPRSTTVDRNGLVYSIKECIFYPYINLLIRYSTKGVYALVRIYQNSEDPILHPRHLDLVKEYRKQRIIEEKTWIVRFTTIFSKSPTLPPVVPDSEYTLPFNIIICNIYYCQIKFVIELHFFYRYLTSSKRQGLLYHNRPCSFTTVALVEFRATRGKFDNFENYKLGKHLIMKSSKS